jgi:acyl-CoA thioesterase-1
MTPAAALLILCLGDSIRIGWAAYLPCTQPKENCQYSRYGVEHLDEWTGHKHYRTVVFNFGLHDLKHHVAPEEYRHNLRTILQGIDAERVFFCTSTDGTFYGGDISTYNRVAREVMAERGVKIIDLYTFTLNHPEWKKADGIHFTEEGYRAMAKYVGRRLTTDD